VLHVRAPRVAAALAVGAALAAAGASYQNLFKNPLVSPDILGVTAGCALGAGLAILYALPIGMIHALSFAGGLAAVALVVAIGTWVGGRDPILTLILAGVVVGSLFGAGIALVKYVADPYNQLPAIVFWLLGSFTGYCRATSSSGCPRSAWACWCCGSCAGASTSSRSRKTRPARSAWTSAGCASS
jgi:iron complex transport system permease protein